MSKLLQEKICLVTGASRGIGRAIAELLAQNSGTVIGTATTQEGADRITQYLKDLDVKGQGLVLDVTDSASVDSLGQEIAKNYGAVSILVNNAGISKDSLMMRMKEEDWATLIDTNLTSVYRLTKKFIRDMMKLRDGRVINISSVVGVAGNIGQTHYAAAKAGVIGFSKSLAVEVASRNITVNSVLPGYIDTDMTEALSDVVKENILTTIPAGRMGTAQEVAHVVLFLASPHSSYITGTSILVDGGMVRK